jgi:hypothetical protein
MQYAIGNWQLAIGNWQYAINNMQLAKYYIKVMED